MTALTLVVADPNCAEAEMYAVWDAGKDGDFLGYMHLDLFPRPNKYGHAGKLLKLRRKMTR